MLTKRQRFYEVFNRLGRVKQDLHGLVNGRGRAPREATEALRLLEQADGCLSSVLLTQQWVEGSTSAYEGEEEKK